MTTCGAYCRTGVVTSAVCVCVVPRADARGSERRRGAVCIGGSGEVSVESDSAAKSLVQSFCENYRALR